MPNGRGMPYKTESSTLVGIGDQGAEVLRRFAETQYTENSDTLNESYFGDTFDENHFVHFWGAGVHTECTDSAFDAFEIKHLNHDDISDRPYVSDMIRPHRPAHARADLDSGENFPDAFEHLESAVKRTVADESERDDDCPSLHQVLVVGDLSDNVTIGTLPLISAMLGNICEEVEIDTHVAGVFSLPVYNSSVNSTAALKAYIGLRELSPLISTFKDQDDITNSEREIVRIPLQEGTISGMDAFDISEGVFDFFGLVGWHENISGEGSWKDSVDTARHTLGYLSEGFVSTWGYGDVRFPGTGSGFGPRRSSTYWLEARHGRPNGPEPPHSDDRPPYSTNVLGTDLPIDNNLRLSQGYRRDTESESHVHEVTDPDRDEKTSLYVHADLGIVSVQPYGQIHEAFGDRIEELADERLSSDCVSYPELLSSGE